MPSLGSEEPNQDKTMPEAPSNSGSAWLDSNSSIGKVLRNLFGRQESDVPLVQETEAKTHSQQSQDQSNSVVSGAQTVGSQNQVLSNAIQALQMHATPTSQNMLNSQGEIRNLILEQRAALSQVSENIDEQMTIDVVAMLFEFILRDDQVPAEVRAQLGRLQFLVLKIALKDPSLLTEKGHPVRMLVNRIGSISLGLKQLDPSGAHITNEICRIVDVLLKDDGQNPSLFSKINWMNLTHSLRSNYELKTITLKK